MNSVITRNKLLLKLTKYVATS